MSYIIAFALSPGIAGARVLSDWTVWAVILLSAAIMSPGSNGYYCGQKSAV